tara:strand:+ start:100 stop:213 length:114 start_codon:yes stop_codon:yes gene_type:complete
MHGCTRDERDEIVTGATRSTMDELAATTASADKVMIF